MTLCAESADAPVELKAWLHLLGDAHDVLATTAEACCRRTQVPDSNVWSPEAVATRLLLRSCGTIKAVLLLTQEAMVVEARTLTRNLIENAFGVAALVDDSTDYIARLQDDSNRSNRNKAEFALKHMPGSAEHQAVLADAVQAVEKSVQLVSPKQLAVSGALTNLYLTYQILSDDAAHATARALERYVARADGGWHYRFEPGSPAELASTLRHAMLAVLGVGIGVTQVLAMSDCNAQMAKLAERLERMPAVTTL